MAMKQNRVITIQWGEQWKPVLSSCNQFIIIALQRGNT